MTEQRVPNLEEVDEEEAHRFLAELLSRLDSEEEYDARHQEDYVMEMPQSGERFRGRENLRAMQRTYPIAAPPSVRLRRVLVRDGLWVVEGAIDYGDGPALDVVMILELRDGRMWRDRWYFPEPFEAPGWRAQWVARMEPGEPDASPEHPAAGGLVTGKDDVRRMMDRQFAKMRVGDLAGAHEWYDEAVVVEWPQSGERVRGRENLLALRQAYPVGVEFEVRRVIARRDLGVGEYVIRYDGRPVYVVAIVEFENRKVVRETHYFAEPFPAPAWRAGWFERMGA
jgi:hypothetical protein